MIKTTILTGVEQEVTFAGTHTIYWVQNLGNGDILVGLEPELADGKDDVLIVPSGGTGYVRRDAGTKTVYLSGAGKAQVYGTNNAFCPFKAVSKGGGEVTSEDGTITTGTVDYPIVSLNLYGNSVQDGAPTPEAPIDIVSVGDDGAVGIVSHGKNLFPYNDLTKGSFWGFYSRLTATTNELTAILTENSASGIGLTQSAVAAALTDYENKQINFSCEIYADVAMNVSLGNDNDNILINIPEKTWVKCSWSGIAKVQPMRIYAMSGINGATLRVQNIQIELGNKATSYEPYKGNTATITSGLALCSVGDVRDELIYNADGTGKIIKRTAKIVLDGSNDEDWLFFSESGAPFQIYLKNGILFESQTELPKLYCNKYQRVPQGATWGNYDYMVSVNVGGTSLVIRDISVTTLEEFKAKLNAVPMAVVYVLATPQEIELSADEITALMKLQTFDGVTNIYNDENAEMTIKVATNPMLSEYVMPVIDGITARYEARIAALEAAVTNT